MTDRNRPGASTRAAHDLTVAVLRNAERAELEQKARAILEREEAAKRRREEERSGAAAMHRQRNWI
jgi:hypothetical protein